MTNELTTQERRYDRLLQNTVEMLKAGEEQNLRRYHMIGESIAKLSDPTGRNTYGDRAVERFASDLEAAGVVKEHANGTRFIYWARSVYNYDPDFQKLAELAAIGLTVTHLKVLLSADETLRPQIEAQILQDGQVVSTRQLAETVRGLCTSLIADTSEEAARENEAIRTTTTDTAPAEVELDPTTPTTEAGAAEVIAGAPANNEAAPETGRPTNPAREVANPVKAIKDTEKAVTRANAKLPDAFIAVRQVGQEGFDSEAAKARYLNNLRAAKASLTAFMQPAQELVASIDSELASHELAAPTD